MLSADERKACCWQVPPRLQSMTVRHLLTKRTIFSTRDRDKDKNNHHFLPFHRHRHTTKDLHRTSAKTLTHEGDEDEMIHMVVMTDTDLAAGTAM